MKTTILLILLLGKAFQGIAQQPDSVKIFIDSALNIMERESIFSKRIHWAGMRDSVKRMALPARTYAEAAPAIKYAFNALGDKHGWLVFDGMDYKNPQFIPDTSRTTENIKQALTLGPRLYNAVVKNNYAYISIHFFGDQSEKGMNRFAQSIQDSLCKVMSPTTKGIIIDLRMNAGGNMYPMFAGLSNILGEGSFSEYPDKEGNVTEENTISKEGVTLNGKIMAKLPRTCGDFSKYPVAIIIGPVTASAGECLAAGFTGRKKSVLIGEVTGGYTTANNGFYLPGYENGMVLSVGYLRDRQGNVYPDNIRPAITVIGGDDFFNHDKDKKIIAAVKWLSKQEL